MRVLHILSSDSLSGAENVVTEIIQMCKEDFDMAYCSPDGPIRDEVEKKGIKFIPIKSLSIKEIRKAVRNFSPDIIHTHDVRASVITAFSGVRKPIVSHIHGNFKEFSSVNVKSAMYFFSYFKFSKIILVSESILKDCIFSKYINGKVKVLYNVIRRDFLLEQLNSDTSEYNFDVVFLGRLVWQKDPSKLVKVSNFIKEKKPEVQIGIIGDGKLRAETEDMVEEMGLKDNVKFLGFMSNPYKALFNAKVFLMTSLREGYPIAALESLLLGVPIVSTPIDGMKTLVKNGENGFLEDDERHLAERVCDILDSKVLHTDLSKGAIKKGIQLNNELKYKQELSFIYTSCIL